ncbi:MAG: sugar phosphate isomerase/epimerase [Clostridia bacterium]|nr:sugar phosphate isomerase/epimerase [Clostridia bacterium]
MRRAAECGFDSIDLDLTWLLPIRWPYSDPACKPVSEFEKMSDDELIAHMDRYKTAADRAGIAIGQAHAVDPPFINMPADDERLLRMIRRTVMICGYLGCHYLIIHPAHCEYDANTMTEDDEWAANMHMFGECIPCLKKYDVVACLENMYIERGGKAYSSICQCPHEANRYIDALNGMAGEKRFAFCLDTGHALMVGMQLNNVIRTLGSRLETLHINDNDGMHDWHMMPLTGAMHWEKVYEGLREIGYSGTLNFELYMHFDREVMPEALRFVAAFGRMMSGKISTDHRT